MVRKEEYVWILNLVLIAPVCDANGTFENAWMGLENWCGWVWIQRKPEDRLWVTPWQSSGYHSMLSLPRTHFSIPGWRTKYAKCQVAQPNQMSGTRESWHPGRQKGHLPLPPRKKSRLKGWGGIQILMNWHWTCSTKFYNFRIFIQDNLLLTLIGEVLKVLFYNIKFHSSLMHNYL